MAEAKANQSGTSTFVSKIVKDPKSVPHVALLSGFRGASSEPDHQRLYLDPQLRAYVDIPSDAVLHEEPIPTDQSPFGGSHIWVKADASLKSGGAGGQGAQVGGAGEFLRGNIFNPQLLRYYPTEFCPTSSPLHCSTFGPPCPACEMRLPPEAATPRPQYPEFAQLGRIQGAGLHMTPNPACTLPAVCTQAGPCASAECLPQHSLHTPCCPVNTLTSACCPIQTHHTPCCPVVTLGSACCPVQTFHTPCCPVNTLTSACCPIRTLVGCPLPTLTCSVAGCPSIACGAGIGGDPFAMQGLQPQAYYRPGVGVHPGVGPHTSIAACGTTSYYDCGYR